MTIYQRTEILIGVDGCKKISGAHVLVVGLGGVGGHAAVALARAGIGQLTLIDSDRVEASNLNRQVAALHSTIGQPKVDVIAGRLRDINPDGRFSVMETFLCAEQLPDLGLKDFDAVVDAIDSLGSKVALLAACLKADVPVFSSMGAGGRMDPGAIQISDLMHTRQCPLARAVRQGVRRQGYGEGVLAVWSLESPRPPLLPASNSSGRQRAINGTISYMPALFGLTLAGCVIRHLLDQSKGPE